MVPSARRQGGDSGAGFVIDDPGADFNGDGAVNFGDLGVLKAFFCMAPGRARSRRKPRDAPPRPRVIMAPWRRPARKHTRGFCGLEKQRCPTMSPSTPAGRCASCASTGRTCATAFDGDTAVALAAAIEGFAAAADARVLVVTGAGDVAFCAGADLKNPWSLLEHRYVDVAGPMGFARLDPGKPTIAAVNGYCFAGGFELAAWCDFRIAAANAEFGCLSRRWGVPYTDGGTQRFARIMGLGNALYLLETGARIDASTARAMGFVQEIVAPGQALARALELAHRIASYPNYPGLCADRKAALATFGVSLDEGLQLEASVVRPTLASDELAAGLERFAAGARDESPRPPATRSPDHETDK